MGVITAEKLTRRYGRRIGIEGVSLDIPEGVVYGFLGPNGAGKTTTIRVLLGFLRPQEGRATVFGLDCWKTSDRVKREVGYLPGDLRLYPWLNGRSAVSLVGRVRGRDLAAPGKTLADRFDLDMAVRVRKMSRGMRQKLGLIIALVHDPRVLILDEPTSGLDPLMRDELGDCLRERAAAGRTVLFSSHTLSEVERLCDHVAIVRAGRIVADNTLAWLRKRAGREVVVEFRDAATATAVTPPPFLSIRERRNARWRCTLDGATPPLIAWAAGQPIADLEVGPPDLETMFRSFYHTPEEA